MGSSTSKNVNPGGLVKEEESNFYLDSHFIPILLETLRQLIPNDWNKEINFIRRISWNKEQTGQGEGFSFGAVSDNGFSVFTIVYFYNKTNSCYTVAKNHIKFVTPGANILSEQESYHIKRWLSTKDNNSSIQL